MFRLAVPLILASSAFASVADDARLVPAPGVGVPKLPPAPAGQEWRPDPAYSPKVNDRATMFSGPGFTVSAIDVATLESMLKATMANEEGAFRDALGTQKIAFIFNNTAIAVSEKSVVSIPLEGDQPLCRVRFLDGPFKGQQAWVLTEAVVRLMLVDKSGSPPPAQKAESLLRTGQALERAGKFKPALSNYREIVDKYPDTPPAKVARERVEALKGK